ncbi:retrovirus-related pol polyprotein from transposon TNT 1-94 [Tanacetum coccineum]
MKNTQVFKDNASNVFRKNGNKSEIQDLKAQMQDKNMVINELKKLILVTKGKFVQTQFDKPSVVRQPNCSIGSKTIHFRKNRLPFFTNSSPEMRSFQTKQSVNKTNVSDGLFKQVTQQNLPQNRKQAKIHSNVLKPGMYRIATTTTQNREPQLPHASRNTNPHVSKSTGVNHTTSVSRPQLKCYQVKDKEANMSNVHPSFNSSCRIVKLILIIVDSGCTKHMTQSQAVVNVQFCDADLECLSGNLLSFGERSSGNKKNLLTGSRGSDLYTISLQETTSSTPICFMAKASPTQAWLWHRRLSHLNFDYITLLLKKDIVTGLPKLKSLYTPLR